MAKKDSADALDKAIARFRFMNPGSTAAEVGAAVGLSGPATQKRINRPWTQGLLEKMHLDIYSQGIAIRERAMLNAAAYVKDPKSREGFEISKIFIQAVADNVATLPDAPSEAPTFFDPAEDE